MEEMMNRLKHNEPAKTMLGDCSSFSWEAGAARHKIASPNIVGQKVESMTTSQYIFVWWDKKLE